MRVLYVSDVYFPRVNGVSTSIRTFRSDLAACNVESLLVAPDYPGRTALPDESDLMRVPSGPVPGDPEDRRMHWRALQRALDALPAGAFDLVHVQTPFVAHYAGVRFARGRGLPCVATYHTFFEEYLHHYVPALPRRLGRTLARAFTRSQCRDLQALVAPSEPMQAMLIEYGVTAPVHVVPTGLPADRFVRGDGARFRNRIGIEPDRPVLTYVGRIAHEKNIEFLVQAFAAVKRRVPRAVFVIAGEGPAHESLRAFVARLGLEDGVRFVGYLDRNAALLDCYAAADAFVFASRTETQGLVLLEAFAQGTPAVSTAELGTRSILRGDCGALVVPENIEAFASAAVRVLEEPELRRRLSEEARAHARRWSSPAMAARLVDVYRGLLDVKKNGAMPSASRREFQVAGDRL